MDLEHALEIAAESKDGGYDSPTDLALQFLAEYVVAEDRQAREECAQQCELRADSLREGSAIARQCAKDIRSRIK
jgi:hypothetical protein